MSYTPGEGLQDDVYTELQRVALHLRNLESESTQFAQHNAVPAKYQDGMTVYADGTNWDPGQGEGLYCYYNGKWNPLEPATGWRDLIGSVDVPSTGSNKPTMTTVNAGPFELWAFGVGDEARFNFHIPHDWVPSASWNIHTHWFPSGTDADPVKWQWTYSYAKSHDQAAFSTTGTVEVKEQAINGTPAAYWHYTTESDSITDAITEPDGIIMVVVKRIAASASNTDTIFMLTTDIHYQSNNRATPNKEPTFY